LSNEARIALAQLTEAQWSRLILELGFYALSVSKQLLWRTGNPVELPNGETVDSVVSLALEKVLTGERHWKPQQAPELKKYLMDVIDSLLNHLATGTENTTLQTLPQTSRRGEPSWDSRMSEWPPDTPWMAQPPPDLT